MFQAIQASLLPRLARLAAQRSFDEFRRGLRLLVLVVTGIGVAGTIYGALLGPWTLRLVYNADLTGSTLAMLALSSALYMMALAISQAVLALEDHACCSRLGDRPHHFHPWHLAVERRRLSKN